MQILGRVINQLKMAKLKNIQDAELFAKMDMIFGKVKNALANKNLNLNIIEMIKDKDVIFIDAKEMAIGRQTRFWNLVANLTVSQISICNCIFKLQSVINVRTVEIYF